MLERITSAVNDRIKDMVHLRQSRRFREESGLFLVEGAALALEASRSDYVIESVCCTERALALYGDSVFPAFDKAEGQNYSITDGIAEKISGQPSPQGIFTVLRMRENLSIGELFHKRRVVLLETVQDPNNLGAVARSALALGFDGMVLSSDSADWRAPKAQRAAMGALLKLSISVAGSIPGTIADLKEEGFTVYAAAMRPDAAVLTKDLRREKTAVVIGNEAGGLKEETIAASDAAVVIPIDRRTESLNAAAAASIFMWELRDD